MFSELASMASKEQSNKKYLGTIFRKYPTLFIERREKEYHKSSSSVVDQSAKIK